MQPHITIMLKDYKQVLKDPDSAKYRNEFVAESQYGDDFNVCGEVNARNSFGGYIGYKKYIWVGSSSEVVIDNNSDNSELFNATWKMACEILHIPKH